MLDTIYIDGRAIRLDPSQNFANGGEANIYLLGDEVLKVYKQSDDPDILAIGDLKERARMKALREAHLAELQLKLPLYPTNMPPRVAKIRKLGKSSPRGGQIVACLLN